MPSYRDFATALALRAGGVIKENFLKGVEREWKQDDTPVTVVDKEINGFLASNGYLHDQLLAQLQ